MKLILASSSPRRREILGWAGVPFTVCVSDADETLKAGTAPVDAVVMLAERKGSAVLAAHPEFRNEDTFILAADTVVDLDGAILGKPHGPEDAARMLRSYSGREHRVHTGICLLHNGVAASCSETTRVRVDKLTEADIDRYISTGEPFGKAGAYAIQGRFSGFVSGIVGDFFNVMGLPVHATAVLLASRFGCSFSDFTE